MTQREPEEVLRKSNAAWTLKSLWDGVWREAYELVLPGVNPYAADRKSPPSSNQQFDSTASFALMNLANRILMDMTPPHDSWVDFQIGPALKMQLQKPQLDAVTKKLDGVSEIMNMIVNHGDCVAARHQAYVDACVSFGCILDLEDAHNDINPIISQSVPPVEVALEDDARGRNVGVYRRRIIKVRDIETLWVDAKIPQAMTDMLKGVKKEKDPEVEILEATYEGGRDKGRATPRWHYEVFWTRGGKDPQRLVEREYDENPWTIFTWFKLPGLPYGPTPVLMAMADIRTANKVVQMILTNAALALAGMYLAKDDGVLNIDNILITNGGVIPVGSTGGPLGASLVPLETGRNFEVGELVLDKFQERINKWLYNQGLPPMTGQVRSATEIIERVTELTRDLGAGLGRLISDHDNYVRRKLGIAVRRGIVPFDIKIDQFTIKMQISSPLARAQQLQEVEKVVRWLQTIISIGGPELAAQVAKLPDIAAWMADRMGVSSELVMDEAERQKAQQDMATVMAAQTLPQPTAA